MVDLSLPGLILTGYPLFVKLTVFQVQHILDWSPLFDKLPSVMGNLSQTGSPSLISSLLQVDYLRLVSPR